MSHSRALLFLVLLAIATPSINAQPAYLRGFPGPLHNASMPLDGTWTNETVDAAGDVGSFSSLALDAQGNPHVSVAASISKSEVTT